MTTEWLAGYGGQTTEELLALEHQYRIDSLVSAFEQGLQARAGDRALSKEERYVLAIEALEREVNNGGYRQFFMNSSNEFVDVIVEALQAIGCSETAAVAKQAIEVLGVEEPPTGPRVEAVVLEGDDRIDQELGKCTDQYFQSGEPIASLLFAWIKLNADRVRV